MSNSHIDVVGFRTHDRKNVRSSSVLPEILPRFRPCLSSSSMHRINEPVHYFIVPSASLAASFVAENMPWVILEIVSTMTRSEAGNGLIET